MARIEIKKIAEQKELNLNNLYRLIYNDKSIKTFGYSSNMVDESEIERIVSLYEKAFPEDIEAKAREKLAEIERQEAKKRELEAIRQKQLERDNMIMTSCQNVDGYIASEQFGLVFGECFYRSSFINRLSATLDDTGDRYTFRDSELTGSLKMVENAREYALKKMKDDAFNRGANAIIGIDAESSFGENFIHVTIYGTAVRLTEI